MALNDDFDHWRKRVEEEHDRKASWDQKQCTSDFDIERGFSEARAYLHDDRDMSQKEVADNLRKVGVEVPVVDEINPEDKVKSQQKKPYRNVTGKAKDRERFTEEEVNALIDGVATYGLGKWSEILTQSFGQFERTGVDLKDKWRNLTLAASRPPGLRFE